MLSSSCVVVVAAAELPPTVVATLPATAAEAGAASPPAFPLQHVCRNRVRHACYLPHVCAGTGINQAISQ